MVFIHTDLEVAQKRNMERPRKLNPEIVENGWNEVQKIKYIFKVFLEMLIYDGR